MERRVTVRPIERLACQNFQSRIAYEIAQDFRSDSQSLSPQNLFALNAAQEALDRSYLLTPTHKTSTMERWGICFGAGMESPSFDWYIDHLRALPP